MGRSSDARAADHSGLQSALSRSFESDGAGEVGADDRDHRNGKEAVPFPQHHAIRTRFSDFSVGRYGKLSITATAHNGRLRPDAVCRKSVDEEIGLCIHDLPCWPSTAFRTTRYDKRAPDAQTSAVQSTKRANLVRIILRNPGEIELTATHFETTVTPRLQVLRPENELCASNYNDVRLGRCGTRCNLVSS